ncbi:MAG: tripartite tricarboxylate transporter substrate binding protein [Desulfatiglandales bacterium]
MKSVRKGCFVFLVVALFFGSFLFNTPAAIAGYPERPITLICPWSAGGGTDRISRMVAVLLEKDMGKPVTVVNRTGGGGAVGHTAGATAKPDGYTITMQTVEILMMHWMGLANVSYKDYRNVCQISSDPAGIIVKADAPWNSVKELQEYIKANPGKLKASGTAKGGIWDLARAGWLKKAGLSLDAVPWVPSAGAAPALQELVAGGVNIVTCQVTEAGPLIDAGKLKALATMSDERNPLYPEVPTLKELGIDWTAETFKVIGVPKKTPDSVANILEKSFEKMVKSKEYLDFMKKNGFGVVWRSSADVEKYLAEADKFMGQLMKEAGLAK